MEIKSKYNKVGLCTKPAGYTLVELLVVISVFVIISSTLTGILYFTLRANNKARVLNSVSKNGNYALSVLSSTIEVSKKISIGGQKDCVTAVSGATTMDLTGLDDKITTIACTTGSNGNITITRPSASAVNLIDNSTNPEVQLTNCQFSCTQTDVYSQPLVTVALILTQSGVSTLQEFQGSADFKTTLYLRNYQYRNNPGG